MEARPGLEGLRGGGHSAAGAAGVARAGPGVGGRGSGAMQRLARGLRPLRCPGTRAAPRGGLTFRGLCVSASLLQITALKHPGTPTRVLVGPASLLYLFFFHDRLCFLSANGKLL